MLALENVFQNVPQPLREEITNLWRRENVLTQDEQINQRLNQVVYVVRDSVSGALVGVSTSEKKRVQALSNHYFYEFRCFIGNAHRVAGLDVKLSKLTFDFLESISKEDENKPIGIFSILENETLKQEPVWRRAVWPELSMYFVGYTNSGNPIRVYYFKGARI
jgi:hypothetical protein